MTMWQRMTSIATYNHEVCRKSKLADINGRIQKYVQAIKNAQAQLTVDARRSSDQAVKTTQSEIDALMIQQQQFILDYGTRQAELNRENQVKNKETPQQFHRYVVDANGAV
jgi:hypothetical protein